MFVPVAALKEKSGLSGSVDVIPPAAPRSIDRSGERGAGRGRGSQISFPPQVACNPLINLDSRFKDGRNWKELEALFRALEAPGRVLDVRMTRLGIAGRARTESNAALRPDARVGPKSGRPENGAAKA